MTPLRCLFIALIGMLPPAAMAQLDFALDLERGESQWEAAGDSVDTTLRRAGIRLYETFDAGPALGLLLGRAWLTTQGYPLTAGMTLEGYYAGISARQAVFTSPRISFDVLARYVYHDLDERNDGQRVSITFEEYGADADARLHLSEAWSLIAGGGYADITGDQRASGAVSSDADLEAQGSWGGRAGVEWNAGADGHVGFIVESGLRDGARLYFQRRF